MIVAFDLEGTLTTGTTWHGVGEYLRQHGQAGRYGLFYAAHVPGALLVKAGLLAMQPYKERWLVDLARLLGGLDAAGLTALGEWVVEHEMWPQRRADALAALRAHLDAGDRVIIASGAYEPVARAFAARVGVGEVLSTPFELQDGHATGRMAQRLGTGQTKLDSLRGLLNGSVLGAAYGDTAADIPMLEAAGQAVAVYPDAALRAYAQAHGWRILDGA